MIRLVITNFILLVFCYHSKAQYKIELLDSNTFKLGEGVVLSKTSFRGLSVVDDQTIWVSGSKGTFARSLDGGKSFEFKQLKGYEKSDFRDIEAFDDKRAIMMSSGTPAYILKTIDGGQTWKEVYKNLDTAYFLDAMDFWDEKRGILVGDPIHGHFVLLQTKDAGETWQELDTNLTPKAMTGEAIFAASGTSLRCWGKNEFGFVSGGSISSIYFSRLNKKNWKKIETNLTINGMGGFSFCKLDKEFIIVGGDYKNDTSSSANTFFSSSPFGFYNNQIIPYGYKSSVEVIMVPNKNSNIPIFPNTILVSTGTSGTQFMNYGWLYHSNSFKFSPNINEPFNVVRKTKKGNAVFLAGGKGRIGKLVY